MEEKLCCLVPLLSFTVMLFCCPPATFVFLCTVAVVRSSSRNTWIMLLFLFVYVCFICVMYIMTCFFLYWGIQQTCEVKCDNCSRLCFLKYIVLYPLQAVQLRAVKNRHNRRVHTQHALWNEYFLFFVHCILKPCAYLSEAIHKTCWAEGLVSSRYLTVPDSICSSGFRYEPLIRMLDTSSTEWPR